MDSHIWKSVYGTVRIVNRSLPRRSRTPKYSDVLIVGMYLWSVWHDRPMCWACDRSHYHSLFRPPRVLPSISQFCRRIKSDRCQTLLQKVYEKLARTDSPTYRCFVDSRPLPVGACSKDQDAKPGRVYSGFARGYKLHAIVSEDARVIAWAVSALNVPDASGAMALIQHCRPTGVLIGDGAYDQSPLYEAMTSFGGRLLAVPRKGAGRGHVRQSADRLTSIFLWRRVGRLMKKIRIRVESTFGNQSSFGGGLGPLPAWARTLERVQRWVGAKLIIYHARKAVKNAAA